MFLYIVMIFYSLLHIPFIKLGFGEPDAWRNGLSALKMGMGLGYQFNRIPGNPIVDLSFGFLAAWVPSETFWVYTNSLTLLISLWGMYIYHKIARYHQITYPIVPVLLLYFIPVIFIGAGSSMDYLWAMTFLLLTYWFLLQVKPLWASIFFALAIGSRVSSVLFFLPFLICLIWNPRVFPRKKLILSTILLLMSVIIPALFYLYVNTNYQFLSEIKYYRNYFRSGYYVLQEIFGLPGTVFLIAMMIWRWKKFPQQNWELVFLFMVVILYLMSFLYHPQKPAYLIPIFPFLVLWISRWLKGKAVYILTGLVIFNNVLGFIMVQPTPEGLKMEMIDKGISWQRYISCQNYRSDVEFLIHYPYPEDTMVIAGWRNPGVDYLLYLPTHQKRKAELDKKQISFTDRWEEKGKKNIYQVWGSYQEKTDVLPSENKKLLFTPSAFLGQKRDKITN